MDSVGAGLCMWGALLAWALIGLCLPKKAGASASTVSRNPHPRSSRKTGPSWEQDVPYPECFEEDDL